MTMKRVLLMIISIILVVSLTACGNDDSYIVVVDQDELESVGFDNESQLLFYMIKGKKGIQEVFIKASELSIDLDFYTEINTEESDININFYIDGNLLCLEDIMIDTSSELLNTFSTKNNDECRSEMEVTSSEFEIEYEIKYLSIDENQVELRGVLKSIDDINEYFSDALYFEEITSSYEHYDFETKLEFRANESEPVETIIYTEVWSSINYLESVIESSNSDIWLRLYLNDIELCEQTIVPVYLNDNLTITETSILCYNSTPLSDGYTVEMFEDDLIVKLEVEYLDENNETELLEIELVRNDNFKDLQFHRQ